MLWHPAQHGYGPVLAHKHRCTHLASWVRVELTYKLLSTSHSTLKLTLLHKARTKMLVGCYVYACPPLEWDGRCGFGGRGAQVCMFSYHLFRSEDESVSRMLCVLVPAAKKDWAVWLWRMRCYKGLHVIIMCTDAVAWPRITKNKSWIFKN